MTQIFIVILLLFSEFSLNAATSPIPKDLILNDPAALKGVLQRKEDYNYDLNREDLTAPLLKYSAPEKGDADPDLVGLLIDHGADVNAKRTLYKYKDGQGNDVVVQQPEDNLRYIKLQGRNVAVTKVGQGDSALMYVIRHKPNP